MGASVKSRRSKTYWTCKNIVDMYVGILTFTIENSKVIIMFGLENVGEESN